MKHNYPGLVRETLPSGNTRWRVRMEGDPNHKTVLKMGPGEPGFDASYRAARHGKKHAASASDRLAGRTLDQLCDAYVHWLGPQVAGGKVTAATLDSRRRGLRQACDVRDEYGDRMGSLDSDLPKAAFVLIWDSFGVRTGAAHTCFKALRAAYKWGAQRGFPEESPIQKMTSEHIETGGAIAWTSQDVQQFLQAHAEGSMARLWFFLADCTACRIGDIRQLGPSNEQWLDSQRVLTWQPEKKGSKRVTVEMTELLLQELEHHDLKARETFIANAHGKTFASKGSLGNSIRKWVIEAGLVDAQGKAVRSQHGIRKGVAEFLALNGASVYEIMATLGHSDPKTTRIYTENAERTLLARGASSKRRGKKTTNVDHDPKRGPHSDHDI